MIARILMGTLLATPLGLALSAQEAGHEKPVSFTKDVMPVLAKHCIECHNPEKKKGKLDMSTYEALKAGGKKKSPFVAGDPDKSLMVQMISGNEPEMPEEGEPLSKETVALISRWIKEGARNDAK